MARLTGGRLAAARAFKAARGRKGLSQKALADATGVLREVINRFETGKTWPDATTQAKLEPAVNMPTGEIEDIVNRYDSEGSLIDEETELLERLTEVQHRRRRSSLTQQQAEILLKSLQEQNRLLRKALDERRDREALHLADELSQMLEGRDQI